MVASIAGSRLAVEYYRRALAQCGWVRWLLVGGGDGGGDMAAALPAGASVTPLSSGVPAAGVLGTLTGVTYTYVGHHPAGNDGWRDDPPISGGGMMLVVGVHVMNLLQHWFREHPSVDGTSRHGRPCVGHRGDRCVSVVLSAGGVRRGGCPRWDYRVSFF